MRTNSNKQQQWVRGVQQQNVKLSQPNANTLEQTHAWKQRQVVATGVRDAAAQRQGLTTERERIATNTRVESATTSSNGSAGCSSKRPRCNNGTRTYCNLHSSQLNL